MERNDAWARVIAGAGAVGAGVALVYVIGGASLSLRYEGFDLPGQYAAAVTPREVLLAAGLRTLALWGVLGIVVILILRAAPDAATRALASRLGSRSGLLTVAAVALALLVVLEVWWPLAAFAGLLAIVLASAYWESRRLRRFLVSAVAVGLVAVAYEADRISYRLEWTCVDMARSADANGDRAGSAESAVRGGRVCGILIGQQDRGFYLGVPGTADQAAKRSDPFRLAFIPATRVAEAYSQKQVTRVIPSRAEARREPLRSRLWNIRVR